MRERTTSLKIVVAVLVGGLAFAILLQTRDKADDDFSNVRSDELVELLKSLDAANQRLSRQITDLTKTRDSLLDSNKRTEAATDAARERADALAILAGTVPVVGPGITISIEDPIGGVDAAVLLDAIEELRNSGAETIVINGTARVVGRTYVVDGDDGIRVDGRVVKAPYVIEAIGDPGTLKEGSRIRGGLVDTVEKRGATVRIVESQRITVTALADSKAPEYARADS